jgi:hypothetical protein
MKNIITWGVVGSGGLARRRTIPEGIVLADCYQPERTGKLVQFFTTVLLLFLFANLNLFGQSHNSWRIPSCAWERKIGAGNFMYNLCGSFGSFYMKPGCYEERFLPQAAFHIREQIKGEKATAYTLATEDVLPVWNKIKPGDGNYEDLKPKLWSKMFFYFQ